MTAVGQRIELPFPVVTNAGFPWGIRCAICHRTLTHGQPYAERLTGIMADGSPLSLLTCVYCEE